MKIIGITGGVGAGKSTVLQIMRQDYHAYIVEADRLAEQLMEPGTRLYQRILEYFQGYLEDQNQNKPDQYDHDRTGQAKEEYNREEYNKKDRSGDTLILPDGQLNRPLIARLIFSDPEALASLNQMVHPAVKEAICSDIEARRGKEPIYLIEAALLIEDGYDAICDELWYIYADPKVRIARLMASRNYSEDKCLRIMDNQASDDYYRAHTRYTIDNTGTMEDTRAQIRKILPKSF